MGGVGAAVLYCTAVCGKSFPGFGLVASEPLCTEILISSLYSSSTIFYCDR
jgi:hypothetical protein